MWVESKRIDVTQLMWDSAGIVRRRADMKAALQHLATLHHEVQVSTEISSPGHVPHHCTDIAMRACMHMPWLKICALSAATRGQSYRER